MYSLWEMCMYLLIGGHMILPIDSFHTPLYLLSNCNVTSSRSCVLCIHAYTARLCQVWTWVAAGCSGSSESSRGAVLEDVTLVALVALLCGCWCKMVQQRRLCIHICVCCQYLSMVKSSNFHANIIFLRCTCMHIELYMLHQRFVKSICCISLRLTRRPLLRLRLAFASPLSAISNRKISSTSSTTSSTITITTAALAPAAAVPS